MRFLFSRDFYQLRFRSETKVQIKQTSMNKTSEIISLVQPTTLVILGAGIPKTGDKPSALRETTDGTIVFEWLLQAFSNQVSDVQFIGGYQFDKITSRYPSIRYFENQDWANTGATGSLFQADLPKTGSLIVTYSDILYRDNIVRDLLDGNSEVIVAVDSKWKDRYQGRSIKDLSMCEKVCMLGDKVTRLGEDIPPELASAEFIGLICINENVFPELRLALKNGPDLLRKGNLTVLVEWLRIRGAEVRALDVAGDWAQFDDPRDLAHFVLGTKAQTLARLRSLVKKSRIEPQVAFSVNTWNVELEDVIVQIQVSFPGAYIVVRSSALSEDGFKTANAGLFKSILNVPVTDKSAVVSAVNKVIESYPDNNLDNQILVQPMIKGVKVSGVVFTRTLERGSPYYVINYDNTTGTTDTVTSGSSNDQKTLVVRRDTPEDCCAMPACLRGLLPAVKEIEGLVGYDSLDIEFAINELGIYILQVRPIAIDHSKWSHNDTIIYSMLGEAGRYYDRLQSPSPFLLGEKTVFGVMPDWNPAEIIGTNPGRLALSLYKYLILDDVWATQRSEYGYRDVRPQPLLVSFANRPYIDVRASFNSFIPREIENSLAKRLINFYLSWLCRHPDLHDKVEFEVVPTCFSLDFERWEQRLEIDGDFTKEEIAKVRNALMTITHNAIERQNKELLTIDLLEFRYAEICNLEINPLDKAYLLLEDCKRFGTLPFAHLARNAFVAVTLLKSAVTRQVITLDEQNDFFNSINTISRKFTLDSNAVANGEKAWEEFVDYYGHLRPGTYDITSISYAEDPERYLRPSSAGSFSTEAYEGKLWNSAKARFFSALAEFGFNDADKIERFMREAIRGREYSKFAFTRNLSGALNCFATVCKEYGLSREQIAQVRVEDLFALRTDSLSVSKIGEWLRKRAEEGFELSAYASAVELPPLLCDPKDFYVFTIPASMPNYIGNNTVSANCIDMTNSNLENDIAGKIVLIPRADPGYDWFFSKGIAGLITMYGGANSHMAIRAAEFGLPAAIGVGEAAFKRLSQATFIELSPQKKWIKVIR